MRLLNLLVVFNLILIGAHSQAVERKHHHRLHEKLVTASVMFPQLYNCKADSPMKDDPVVSFNKSQGREDMLLYDTIFSKLPLNEVLGGTYIEIGALDGVTLSNTHFFEKKLDFRGVLIEGQPTNQVALRKNAQFRSNAAIFTMAICAFDEKHLPGLLNFTNVGGPVGAAKNQTSGAFLQSWHKSDLTSAGKSVVCMPMQTILESTGLMDVDLFSLDVEGAEMFVLNTMNFKEINIRVILVELDYSDKAKNAQVRTLLTQNGFLNSTAAGYGSPHDYCLEGPDTRWRCLQNEVFVNPHFTAIKAKRSQQIHFNRYYEANTGVPCAKQYGYNGH